MNSLRLCEARSPRLRAGELHKVIVFGDDDGLHFFSLARDFPVISALQAKVTDRDGFVAPSGGEHRRRRREWCVDDQPHSAGLFGCGNDIVSRLGGRIGQCGTDIFVLDIRKIVQDLILGRAGCQHAQDVGDADPHPPNAGMTATLFGARRNPGEQGLRHSRILSGLGECDQREPGTENVTRAGCLVPFGHHPAGLRSRLVLSLSRLQALPPAHFPLGAHSKPFNRLQARSEVDPTA